MLFRFLNKKGNKSVVSYPDDANFFVKEKSNGKFSIVVRYFPFRHRETPRHRKLVVGLHKDTANRCIDKIYECLQSGKTDCDLIGIQEGEGDDAPDRNPPTRLAVTMSDGTTIKHRDASDTFVEVIDYIGRWQVRDLKLEVNGKPLMITSEDDQNRHKLGGFYINVGTSTKTKKRLLEDIASHLKVELKVEIIPK